MMRLTRSLALLALAGCWAYGCGDAPTVVIEPLRVINLSPASGAVCVDVSTQVRVTFSDDIETKTLTVESFRLLDGEDLVAASIGYDKTRLTATLTPAAELAVETLYTVEATTAVTGTNQGPLPSAVTSLFETVGPFGCTP